MVDRRDRTATLLHIKLYMHLEGNTFCDDVFVFLVAVTIPNPGVGFSVYMTALKGKHLTLGHEQTVVYDGILTNEGNGYDDRTGVFTCPVAGTYMFVVDSAMGSRSWIHMKLNKTIVASLYRGSPQSQDPWLQISRTVVLKLKVGDHVKVVTGGNNVLIHKETYSGFTGTLLF